MDNTDRIRELLLQIHDAEETLAGLRVELRRLVAEGIERHLLNESHTRMSTPRDTGKRPEALD